MSDWSTIAEWETRAGVEHRVEEQYNHRQSWYEVRVSIRARDTWFVKDQWNTNDPVEM